MHKETSNKIVDFLLFLILIVGSVTLIVIANSWLANQQNLVSIVCTNSKYAIMAGVGIPLAALLIATLIRFLNRKLAINYRLEGTILFLDFENDSQKMIDLNQYKNYFSQFMEDPERPTFNYGAFTLFKPKGFLYFFPTKILQTNLELSHQLDEQLQNILHSYSEDEFFALRKKQDWVTYAFAFIISMVIVVLMSVCFM